MLQKLKTKINDFLWTNRVVKRVCKSLFVKKCYFTGFQEQRKKIDPRYTNPLYPEFIDRRKDSRLRPIYETRPTSICGEHPLYKYIMLIGIIATIFFLALVVLYLRPPKIDVEKPAPKTIILGFSHDHNSRFEMNGYA
jgi:hypothetical protein